LPEISLIENFRIVKYMGFLCASVSLWFKSVFRLFTPPG